MLISDDDRALSQAAMCGCRPMFYSGEKEAFGLWEFNLNLMEMPALGTKAVERAVKRINEDLPYSSRQAAAGKLQIGCGTTPIGGWLNTDIREGGTIKYLDASRSYSFADETFNFVFSEHLFEHLSVEGGQNMLRECYRVLKPGGRFRLTMPCLEFLIHLYENPEDPQNKEYIEWSISNFDGEVKALFPDKKYPAMFIVNNFIRQWGHRMVYDRQTIRALLEKQGFARVDFVESGKSEFPELRNVEHHGKVIPSWANSLESMTLEAVKL